MSCTTMSENIKKIRDIIIPILKEEGVLRSSLFGSYARNEATEKSDLDILIELPKGKSLLDLVNIENKVISKLGRDVDLITYASVHPRLRENIEKDQIPLL